MSDDVDVVKSYCDAWLRGDLMAVLAHYHDDLTLEWEGNHRLADTYVGQQASLDALLELQALTGRTPVEILQMDEEPPLVTVTVLERWTSPADAEQVLELTRDLIFTVEDAKLRTCRVVENNPDAVDRWLTD